MTRASKEKKERILNKYQEYQLKLSQLDETNLSMINTYKNKLKTIRMTLSLLEIHIVGINQVKEKEN